MSRKKIEDNVTPVRPKCYVVGGGFDYIRLLFSLGCDGAKGLGDADFVLFTGGEDVTPELYGEVAMAKTNYNRLRDQKEQAIYEAALSLGLPMVGICRGGQFLNVMNKGRMWQHVTGHTGSHMARVESFEKNRRRVINVTSTHHQMMIPAKDGIVLLTASEAFEKHSPLKCDLGRNEKERDVEVVFYDGTNCLCFQPHPEFNHATPDCVDFFEECLDDFIYPRTPLRGGTPSEKAIIEQIPAAKKKEK